MSFEMVPFLKYYLLIWFLVGEKVRGSIPEKIDLNNVDTTDVHYSNVENLTARDLYPSPLKFSLFDTYNNNNIMLNEKAYNQQLLYLRPVPSRLQQYKKQNLAKPKVNPAINSKINPILFEPTDFNSNESAQSTDKPNELDKPKSADETLDEEFVRQVRRLALGKLKKIRRSTQLLKPFKVDKELNAYSQSRADAMCKGKTVDKTTKDEMKYTKPGTKEFNNPETLANDIISVWQVTYPKAIYGQEYRRYKFGLGVAKSPDGKFYAVGKLT